MGHTPRTEGEDLVMLDTLKNLLIGSPVSTKQLGETRLNKVRALASFSPGALSPAALTVLSLRQADRMKAVFVDTWAWYAMTDKADDDHLIAQRSGWRARERANCFTSPRLMI